MQIQEEEGRALRILRGRRRRRHTLFVCQKFDEERGRLSRIIGVTLTTDNMVQEMLRNEKNWNIISKHVGAIMKIKEEDLQN